MSPFWSLVRNDVKMVRRNDSYFIVKWILFFLITSACFSVFFYLVDTEKLKITDIYWIEVAFMMVAFGFSSFVVKQEWDASTINWWITLPYPRHWLIASKCLAITFRILQSLCIVLVLTKILTIFGMLYLYGQWQSEWMISLWNVDLFMIYQLVIFSPLFITMSVAIVVIGHSRWKGLQPFLGVVYGVLLIPAFGISIWKTVQSIIGSTTTHFLIDTIDWVILLAAWGSAVVLFTLSVYVLKRKTEV